MLNQEIRPGVDYQSQADQVWLLADFSRGQEEPLAIPLDEEMAVRLEEVLFRKDMRLFESSPDERTGAEVAFKTPAALSIQERDDFEGVYENYSKPIFGYIYWRLFSDRLEAEDLTMEVFSRALARFSEFVPREDLKDAHRSWLYRITRNMLQNRARDIKRRLQGIKEIPLETLRGEKEPIWAFPKEPTEDIVKLRKAMASFPPHWQFALWGRYSEGLTIEEMSEVLGKSEKAVISILWRARQRLEKEILND